MTDVHSDDFLLIMYDLKERCLSRIRKATKCSITEAEDLFMEVVLDMYEKQIDFSTIKDLSSYLVVSGLNRWRKRYAAGQKKLAEERNVLHYFYEYLEDNYPPGLEDPPDMEIRFKAVEQSLLEMNEKCRSVLTRFYLEGQTMVEIADTMDFKSSGVANIIKYRCLKGLKRLVEEVIKKLD